MLQMPPDSHRPSTDRSRRQFLTRGGTVVAGSLSILTTGCLSSLPPLGDDQRYGRLDAPPASDPTYRKWLPAPSSLDRFDEPYHFVALDSTTRRPDAPEKLVAGRAHLKASLDYFGIGFENYDRVVSSLLGTVIEASFKPSTVVRTIEDGGYERTGEYRDFTIFSRSDTIRRVGVGDSVVVWASEYRHEAPNLEAIIDAGTGHRPRYHEENGAFDRLVTAAGSNPYLGVNTDIHDPTGRRVLMADAFRFDEEAAYQVVHYYYRQNDSSPTREALERGLQNDDYRFTPEADTFDVVVNDRFATVETRVPLDDSRELPPEYDFPQVTWGLTREDDRESVTVRHEAGEPVPAHRLFYDLEDHSAPNGIDKRPLWPEQETVERGSTATVDLKDQPEATGVNLVYSTGGASFHVLFGADFGGNTDD